MTISCSINGVRYEPAKIADQTLNSEVIDRICNKVRDRTKRIRKEEFATL